MITGTKIVSSLTALALLLLHQFHPAVTIDAMSLGLIILMFFPWLLNYIKGLEFAGVKIELRDLISATNKLDLDIRPGTPHVPLKPIRANVDAVSIDDRSASLRSISETHPNLALVQFRLEIELRVRELARSKSLLNERVPLNRLIRALVQSGIIDSQTGAGLVEIVALGNQAAHNANVSSDAANYILDVGPGVLTQLDEILAAAKDAG